MLASGAHVKIGSYEFDLDETIDAGSLGGGFYTAHYKYSASSLITTDQPVAGTNTRIDALRPGRLVQYWDDWRGGENSARFDPDDPTTYAVADGANTRRPHSLTGRPERIPSAINNFVDNSKAPIMGYGAGAVWMGSGYDLNYSTDGYNWSTAGASSATTASDYPGFLSLSSSYNITALAGDDHYIFYAGYKSSGTLRTLYAKVKDATTLGVKLTSAAEVTGTAYAGLAVMNNTLFAWTGKTLTYFNVGSWDGSTALTENASYGTGNTIDSSMVLNTDYYAGCVAAENSVFSFFSRVGYTVVYQTQLQADGSYATSPIWQTNSLQATCITYHNGVLFVGGNSVGAAAPELWAVPQDTGRPVFVGAIRPLTNSLHSITAMCPGPHATILIGIGYAGITFIYDMDQDAFSQLDDLGGYISPQREGQLYVAATNAGSYPYFVGGYRGTVLQALGSTTGTSYTTFSYYSDFPYDRFYDSSTAATYWEWTSPAFDNGLPFQQKTLLGISITFEPFLSSANQQLTVGFVCDSATVKESTTQPSTSSTYSNITYATTGANQGRVYIDLSGRTDTNYTNLQIAVEGGFNTTGPGQTYSCPLVYSIATDSALIAYEYTWDLIIKLDNFIPGSDPGRKAAVTDSAVKKRNYIRGIIDNKAVVTFLDGYRYAAKGGSGVGYSSHTVFIEDPEDTIVGNSEGHMRLRLRSVPA